MFTNIHPKDHLENVAAGMDIDAVYANFNLLCWPVLVPHIIGDADEAVMENWSVLQSPTTPPGSKNSKHIVYFFSINITMNGIQQNRQNVHT